MELWNGVNKVEKESKERNSVRKTEGGRKERNW